MSGWIVRTHCSASCYSAFLKERNKVVTTFYFNSFLFFVLTLRFVISAQNLFFCRQHGWVCFVPIKPASETYSLVLWTHSFLSGFSALPRAAFLKPSESASFQVSFMSWFGWEGSSVAPFFLLISSLHPYDNTCELVCKFAFCTKFCTNFLLPPPPFFVI